MRLDQWKAAGNRLLNFGMSLFQPRTQSSCDRSERGRFEQRGNIREIQRRQMCAGCKICFQSGRLWNYNRRDSPLYRHSQRRL